MATIQATLNITSSDATSENLSISQSDTLAIKEPVINTARETIATGGPTLILDSTIHTSDTWVYLKNVDATNYITIRTDAAVDFGKLLAGEFMVFCLPASVGLECEANAMACILEYGIWTV